MFWEGERFASAHLTAGRLFHSIESPAPTVITSICSKPKSGKYFSLYLDETSSKVGGEIQNCSRPLSPLQLQPASAAQQLPKQILEEGGIPQRR